MRGPPEDRRAPVQAALRVDQLARRTVQAWGEGRAEIPASVASLARIMDAVAQREPREIVARVMRAEAELLSAD